MTVKKDSGYEKEGKFNELSLMLIKFLLARIQLQLPKRNRPKQPTYKPEIPLQSSQ
jgi:hypothetical protein